MSDPRPAPAPSGIDPEHWRELPEPRIPPASSDEIHILLRPLIWVSGRAVGGPPPNIFRTLARHGKLFASWLPFAGHYEMLAGTLLSAGVQPEKPLQR